MADWTAMQARLAPVFRSAGDNIAFTIILMGYHQFGTNNPELSIDRLWPKRTKVDVAGFDIYDTYGTTRNGVVRYKHTDLAGNYYPKIAKWASETGVRWALGETGFTNASAAAAPDRHVSNYRELVRQGGVAYAYFNSSLNSSANWELDTALDRSIFKQIAAGSPRLF